MQLIIFEKLCALCVPVSVCCVLLYMQYNTIHKDCLCACVAESRCILLPVVLRVLQVHMKEQRDLVMCARILTSMLSLIKKEENGTAVSHKLVICSPLHP